MALKGWCQPLQLCLLLLVLACQRQAVCGQTTFQPDETTTEPTLTHTEKCSHNEAIESEISSLKSRVSHLLSVLRQHKESLSVTDPPATTQVLEDECQQPCLRIYAPVCGSDNKTYSNHCVFEIAQCMDETLTASAGECPIVPCDRPCTRILHPVCGSDGNTYDNECMFSIAQCKDESLTSTPGPCASVVLSPCDEVECEEPFCPEDVQYEFDCCPRCPQDYGLDPCHFTGTCGEQPIPDLCALVECDVLPCPEDVQHTYDGECCPECPQDWGLDPCHLSGTCDFPIEVLDPCADVECDELPCPEDLQHTYFGQCCPECPEDWGVDPCEFTGTCFTGVTEIPDPCADVECNELPCPEDLQLTYFGQCCPECPQDWGLDPCHWTNTCDQQPVTTQIAPPKDCSEVDDTMNGVYQVYPDGGEPISVYCDFDTPHGPWTVIQRRSDGSVDFYQRMAEYQAGFGNLEGEFWLGLDNIYKFVSTDVYRLRIDLTNFRDVSKHATYNEFSISDESDGYRLHLGNYSGNARDSLSYHKGMQFTTRDVDRDENDKKNCARFHKGAWWYKRCFRSNLNGRHRDPLQKRPDGIIWAYWRGYTETIPFVEMKIQRPL